MKHGNSRRYFRRAARVVRSLVHRHRVLFGGRKMRRLLYPAFWWVVIMTLLAFGQLLRGDTASVDQASLTVTVTSTAFNYSYVVSKTDGVSYGGVSIHPVDGSGNVTGGNVINKTAVADPLTGTGSAARTASQRYRMRAAKFNWSNALITDQIIFIEPNAVSKKVRVSYFNSREFPVRLKLVDSANPSTVIAETLVAGGTGFIQTIALPLGVNDATLLTFVEDFSRDGPSWVVDEGAVTQIGSGTNVPGVETDGDPSTTTVPEPPGLPGKVTPPSENPVSQPRPTVWFMGGSGAVETTDAERLDKATFREGVDKLEVAVKGLGFPDEVGESNMSMPEVETPEGTELPEVNAPIAAQPTFFTDSFGTATVVSATIPAVNLGGGVSWPSHNFSVDFSDYSTAVTLIRGVLSLLLVVGFFILCVRTARGSSATE